MCGRYFHSDFPRGDLLLVEVFHGGEVDHVQYLIEDGIDLIATVMKKQLRLDAAQ